MAIATLRKRKQLGLCYTCGEVNDAPTLSCSECKAIHQIKRRERNPLNPTCACGGRRVMRTSNWATCYVCRSRTR